MDGRRKLHSSNERTNEVQMEAEGEREKKLPALEEEGEKERLFLLLLYYFASSSTVYYRNCT